MPNLFTFLFRVGFGLAFVFFVNLEYASAQTYISNGNCLNWADGACWEKIDDDSGDCTNSTSAHPPSNPSTSCPVKVIINHPMSRSSNQGLTFGGSFESITFGPEGSLNLTNGFTISDNYTLSIFGDPDGPENYLTAPGMTLGSASGIYVDKYAGLVITGITQFTKHNGLIKVDGYYKTNTIATTGNSSLTLDVDKDATVIVDLDIDMNGNSRLTFIGNGEDPEYVDEEGNSRSVVDIRGRIKTNGSGAEIAADNITVFICNGIDSRVKRTETNTGKFETYCMSELPVIWLDTVGSYDQKCHCAFLDWSTLKEWENSHFEIERSVDGIGNFQKVGRVEGRGWASEITEYRFVDEAVPISGGRFYYRIKQVDFNSAFEYSEVYFIKMESGEQAKANWQIYPNPSNGGRVKLRLLERKEFGNGEIFLRVIGPSLINSAPVHLAFNQQMEWDITSVTEKLPQGVYVVELSSSNKVSYLKLIK